MPQKNYEETWSWINLFWEKYSKSRTLQVTDLVLWRSHSRTQKWPIENSRIAYRELRKGRWRYRQVTSSFENSEISTSIHSLENSELSISQSPFENSELSISQFTRELRVVDKPSQPWSFRDIDNPIAYRDVELSTN